MSHRLLTVVLLSNFLLVSLIADNAPVKKDYRRKGAMLKVYKQEKPPLSKQPEKQKELEELKHEEEKEMREEVPPAPSMEGYGKKKEKKETEKEMRDEVPPAPSMEGYDKKKEKRELPAPDREKIKASDADKKIKKEALEEQRARLKKAETREKKTQFEETGVKGDILKGRDDQAKFGLKKTETKEKQIDFESAGVKGDIQKGRDNIAHFKLKKTETIKREKVGSPEAEALKKAYEKFEQPEPEGDSTNQTPDDWE